MDKGETPPDGMILVKGGWFDMGDVFGDDWSEESPVHRVWVDDFFMGIHLVTQGEYARVMGKNPSFHKGDSRLPVEQVTWNDANEYCMRVGKRLPTEAEWEYAARSGGKKVKYATSTGELHEKYFFDVGLKLLANCDEKLLSIPNTTVVGSYPPNELGIYDMSGNVREWVADWYDSDYYKNSPEKNPQGPLSGVCRVLRGGSCEDDSRGVSVTGRRQYFPEKLSFWKSLLDPQEYSVGFRCAK